MMLDRVFKISLGFLLAGGDLTTYGGFNQKTTPSGGGEVRKRKIEKCIINRLLDPTPTPRVELALTILGFDHRGHYMMKCQSAYDFLTRTP